MKIVKLIVLMSGLISGTAFAASLGKITLKNTTGKELKLEVRVPCTKSGVLHRGPFIPFAISSTAKEQIIDLDSWLATNPPVQKIETCFYHPRSEYRAIWWAVWLLKPLFNPWLLNLFEFKKIPMISMRIYDPSKTICTAWECDGDGEETCSMTDCIPVDARVVDTGFVDIPYMNGKYTIKVIQGSLRVTDRTGHNVLTPAMPH
jgi:hypothetical protein